ncbi:MAG TPA: alpha/beta hydrolase family protein [Terriglobia bacterium]|nr:alpha/beta hydrolase family protein [Terriglobia bacterium]
MIRTICFENHGSECGRLHSILLGSAAILLVAWTLGSGSMALAAAPGTIQCDSVPSKILDHPVDYCIDLPASYASSNRRYPVIYFLHGLFGNDHRWIDRGGKEIFDRLTADGTIGPVIVVLPDGGETFYINSEDGKDRYEDFFTQELVPFIDHQFRTIGSKGARAISGVSMGGYGALHLAMRHSDLFGSVAATSAVLVGELPDPLPAEGRWQFYSRILSHAFGSPINQAYWKENSPLTLAKDPSKFQGLKIYFDVGDQDRYGFDKGAALLDEILTKEGYPHTYALRQGGHGWDFLDQYMPYSLRFLWQSVEKAAQPSNSSAEVRSH